MKTIGILGAGHIAQALAKHFAKAGYSVLISNSRGKASLAPLAAELGQGIAAADASEAAAQDLVAIAIPWTQLASTLPGLTNWEGKTVIDATNHIIAVTPEFQLADLGGKYSSEVVSSLIPGAHLVKAFNTLFAKLLAADPAEGSGNRVLFYSGDHADAKKEVAAAIQKMGFAPIDLGTIAEAGRLQGVGGALSSINLVKLG